VSEDGSPQDAGGNWRPYGSVRKVKEGEDPFQARLRIGIHALESLWRKAVRKAEAEGRLPPGRPVRPKLP
jgi:hypothetical protein